MGKVSNMFLVDVVERNQSSEPKVVEINEVEFKSELQLSMEFLKYSNCIKQAYLTVMGVESGEVHFNFMDGKCIMDYKEFKNYTSVNYPELTV